MNNIFDIKRFGNCLLYDLKRAYGHYSLSMLICVMMPVVMFAVIQIFSLLFFGGFNHGVENAYAVIAGVASLTAFIITFPSKVYGQVTEKRYGSSWLMLPASGFEKFLSMILMVAVIAPAVFAGLFLTVDGIMSLLFNSYYGNSIIYSSSALYSEFIRETDGLVNIHFGSLFYLALVEYMLIFTLGAIWFKTSKAAKTIIAIFIISSVLSTLVFAIVGANFTGLQEFFMSADNDIPYTVGKTIDVANLLISLDMFVSNAILLCCIYFRIKTLKH